MPLDESGEWPCQIFGDWDFRGTKLDDLNESVCGSIAFEMCSTLDDPVWDGRFDLWRVFGFGRV